jgi:hypothetical protein
MRFWHFFTKICVKREERRAAALKNVLFLQKKALNNIRRNKKELEKFRENIKKVRRFSANFRENVKKVF